MDTARSACWEQSPWLGRNRATHDFSNTLHDLGLSIIKVPDDRSAAALFGALLKCQSNFVPLINETGEFQELYDPQANVARFANRLVEVQR